MSSRAQETITLFRPTLASGVKSPENPGEFNSPGNSKKYQEADPSHLISSIMSAQGLSSLYPACHIAFVPRYIEVFAAQRARSQYPDETLIFGLSSHSR